MKTGKLIFTAVWVAGIITATISPAIADTCTTDSDCIQMCHACAETATQHQWCDDHAHPLDPAPIPGWFESCQPERTVDGDENSDWVVR